MIEYLHNKFINDEPLILNGKEYFIDEFIYDRIHNHIKIRNYSNNIYFEIKGDKLNGRIGLRVDDFIKNYYDDIIHNMRIDKLKTIQDRIKKQS